MSPTRARIYWQPSLHAWTEPDWGERYTGMTFWFCSILRSYALSSTFSKFSICFSIAFSDFFILLYNKLLDDCAYCQASFH